MSRVESQKSQLKILELRRLLYGDVFAGPSAILPINSLCSRAFAEGLLAPGNKFKFVGEIAAMMHFMQQHLPLEQIAKLIGRETTRVEQIAGFMTEVHFPTFNTRDPLTLRRPYG